MCGWQSWMPDLSHNSRDGRTGVIGKAQLATPKRLHSEALVLRHPLVVQTICHDFLWSGSCRQHLA